MIHWPDLTGAQTETGMICVGQVENRKSRSKFSRTYLVFYDPTSRPKNLKGISSGS